MIGVVVLVAAAGMIASTHSTTLSTTIELDNAGQMWTFAAINDSVQVLVDNSNASWPLLVSVNLAIEYGRQDCSFEVCLGDSSTCSVLRAQSVNAQAPLVIDPEALLTKRSDSDRDVNVNDNDNENGDVFVDDDDDVTMTNSTMTSMSMMTNSTTTNTNVSNTTTNTNSTTTTGSTTTATTTGSDSTTSTTGSTTTIGTSTPVTMNTATATASMSLCSFFVTLKTSTKVLSGRPGCLAVFSVSTVQIARSATSFNLTVPKLASVALVDQLAPLSSLLVEAQTEQSNVVVLSHVTASLDKPTYDPLVYCEKNSGSEFGSCPLSQMAQRLVTPTIDATRKIAVHFVAPSIAFNEARMLLTATRTSAVTFVGRTRATPLRMTWLPSSAVDGLSSTHVDAQVVTVAVDWAQAFGSEIAVELRMLVHSAATVSLLEIDGDARWRLVGGPTAATGLSVVSFDVSEFVRTEAGFSRPYLFAPVLRSPNVSFAFDSKYVMAVDSPMVSTSSARTFPRTTMAWSSGAGSTTSDSNSGSSSTFVYVGAAIAVVGVGGAVGAAALFYLRKRRQQNVSGGFERI